MSKISELLPHLSEEDNVIPTVRVVVMLGGEVLLNKIVSKKTRIRDILIANKLDPDKIYLLDNKEVNVDNTILQASPRDKGHLVEAEFIIEMSPFDLESKHEIRYDPIVRPVEKPFRLLVYNPRTYNLSMKSFLDSYIKSVGLENYLDFSNASCNTSRDLYISGGKNGGKGDVNFWRINKLSYKIDRLKNLKSPKEEHSMFFVPKKYIYFIGGNTQETFFYNILKDQFEDWGPLNKKRIKPCVALANKSRLYVFDAQPNKKNVEFIEKCNLAKGREWELLKVKLSEQFYLTNFSAAVDTDEKIYLFGGRKKPKERTFVFDPKQNSLVPFEQENSSKIGSDKTFYPISDYNSALIPNVVSDEMNVLIFNRKKRRFKKLRFKPEVEELIDVKEFKPKDKNDNQEKDDRLNLFFKRVDEKEPMPSLPEGLIRFPTLDELKAPPKKLPEQEPEPEPEIKAEVNPPELNIEGPKIEGEVGLPGVDIKGPKIEGEVGLPGIDIKGPKIEAGIDIQKPKVDVPGVEVDIQGPNVDANIDLNPPRVILRGPKGKKKGKGKEPEPKVDVNAEASLPSLGAMLDSNVDVNLNLPKVDVPSVDISGPKVDVDVNLEKPKIEEPKVVVPVPEADIHGNLPSLSAMLDPNAGIAINAPQVEVPKVGDVDLKKDVEVGLPNVGIDINAPKIRGEIGLPGLDIHGPKIDAGIDIKGPSIDVNVEPEKKKKKKKKKKSKAEVEIPNVDIEGPKIEAGVDINVPLLMLE